MSFDLAKVIKELGDQYKYFKYVPSTHREYAQQDLDAFKKLVRNTTYSVTGMLSHLSPIQLDEQIGKRIYSAYIRSDKAKAWIEQHK